MLERPILRDRGSRYVIRSGQAYNTFEYFQIFFVLQVNCEPKLERLDLGKE